MRQISENQNKYYKKKLLLEIILKIIINSIV